MDIALSESQKLLRDTLRAYLEQRLPFSRVRQVERTGEYDRDLWAYLAGAEYLSLPFAAEHGGQDGHLEDIAVVVEEFTRRAAVIPAMETLLSAFTIARFAEPALVAEVASAVSAGKMTIAPAFLDASTPAEVTGGVLGGQKLHVEYGQVVTHHLVVATDESGEGLFLVDASAATHEPLTTIARTPRAHSRYEDVPAKRVADADAVTFFLRAGRALAAVQCLANSQQALDMTVEYVGGRVQFGRPIGSFQAVQHHCADMATKVEAARFLVYEAAWKLDRDLATDVDIAVAKAWASRTASDVPMMAHQLHGGVGVTEEYDLHFFSRHAKERSLSWGTAEDCLRIIAASYAP